MIENILVQLPPEQIRLGLLLLEFYLLLIPPVVVFIRNKSNFDSFHPVIIFSAAFSLFYFFPQVYYYFLQDFHLFSENQYLAIISLIWTNIALASFYIGYYISSRLKIIPKLTFRPYIPPTRFLFIFGSFLLIALLSFVYLMESSGGLLYYLTNQDKTIDLTAGKIYWLWGILLFRTAFMIHFLYVLQEWKSGNLNKYFGLSGLLLHGFLAGLLIFVVGARLLLASYVIEAAVVFHYAIRRIKLRELIGLGVVSFVLIVIVMGAWRNYGSSEGRGFTFEGYLANDITKNLGERLFNAYFDSVRNFGYTLKYTGHGMPVQEGRTYLALLVQPIPRDYRPGVKLPLGEEMNGIYCGSPKGGDYCGIDPLLGELYQNFVGYGIPIGLFILGFITSLVYGWLVKSPGSNNFSFVLYGIYAYSIFLWLRGTFIGHTSLILMDLLPLLLLQSFFRDKISRMGAR